MLNTYKFTAGESLSDILAAVNVTPELEDAVPNGICIHFLPPLVTTSTATIP